MIDPENAVYTTVATAVRTEHSGAKVSGELNLNPAEFPAVYIEMSDCYPYTQGADGSTYENFCVAVFEVNIYSAKTNGRKSEAKAILHTVDTAFSGIGFQRTAAVPMNGNDATKYRIVARYEAVVSKDFTVYRR